MNMKIRHDVFIEFVKSLDRGLNNSLIEAIEHGFKLIFESDNTDYDKFVRKTDGMDILYHGGAEYKLTDMSFFTDYVGHAYEYGDYVNGIITDLSNKSVLLFDDNTFDKLRKNYSNLTVKDIKNISYYQKTINAGKIDKGDSLKTLKILKSSTPYTTIAKNPQMNDLLIPIMLDYATKLGYNIIAFWGNDYAAYGGAMEFVVGDVSKYKTLTDMWSTKNNVNATSAN